MRRVVLVVGLVVTAACAKDAHVQSHEKGSGAWFEKDGGTIYLVEEKVLVRWHPDGGCDVATDGGLEHEDSRLCDVMQAHRSAK